MKIYQGPPQEVRTEREMRIYKLLTEIGIDYERIDHAPLKRAVDGVQVEEAFGIDIYKNLFLCNGTKTRYFLFSMMGDKRLNTRALSRLMMAGRLHFASEAEMEALIGTKPGAVSILGLMYDKQRQVQLLIDADIIKKPYWGCHPCVNTTSLKISLNDILHKFLKRTGHSPVIVKMEEREYKIEPQFARLTERI